MKRHPQTEDVSLLELVFVLEVITTQLTYSNGTSSCSTSSSSSSSSKLSSSSD